MKKITGFSVLIFSIDYIEHWAAIRYFIMKNLIFIYSMSMKIKTLYFSLLEVVCFLCGQSLLCQ